MQETSRDLLSEFNQKADALWRELTDAYWAQATGTGDGGIDQRLAAINQAWMDFHGDTGMLDRANKIMATEILDERTSRELALLRFSFMKEQTPEEIRGDIAQKESQLSSIFAKARAQYQGRSYSENEVDGILRTSTDNEEREKIWHSSKAIGDLVAPVLLELVRLRNHAARQNGFRDFYQMGLELDEIPEDDLFELIYTLEEKTRDAYFLLKEKQIEDAQEKFGIGLDAIRPWHETDLYGSKAPLANDNVFEEILKGQDPVELCRKTYQALGLPVDHVLEKSDLYAREGKAQTAFCIGMDRAGDVRILANVEAGQKWTETMLHECGHSVYEACIDKRLPWILRTVPHANSTEGVAMLMGRQAKNLTWLGALTQAPPDVLAKAEDAALDAQAQMLYFTRFALVMVMFERELYEDPDQDLNELWWSLVEDIQGISRPPGEGQHWACKSHLSTAPIYYQNYILGELTASQYLKYLLTHFGRNWFLHEDAGKWLQDKVFFPGAVRSWNEALKYATGEYLSPDAFLAQYG